MIKIARRENESVDDMIRRFKREVNKSHVVYDCMSREYHMNRKEKREFKKKYLNKQ